MSHLAIDLGLIFSSAASADLELRSHRLLGLGGNSRASIPSLIYVPVEGPLEFGEDADRRVLRDPQGVVRNLPRLAQRTEAIFRNGRRVSATDLIAGFFQFISERCRLAFPHASTIQGVILPTKLTATPEIREALVSAAMLGGLINVSTVDAALCIASAVSAQEDPGADAMIVVDLGGGSTEICCVEKRRQLFRRHPRIEPQISRGVASIDEMLWDELQATIDGNDFSAEEFVGLRTQLQDVKHCYARRQTERMLIQVGSSSIEIPRPMIERCVAQYFEDAFTGLSTLLRAMSKDGLSRLPLVLAGGGANLYGVEQAIRDRGWTGTIIRPRPPELLPVLGAAQIALNSQLECPDCAAINSRQGPVCIRCGRVLVDTLPPPETIKRSFPAIAATAMAQMTEFEFVTCPEAGCGTRNPSSRTYCSRCGCPLPAAMIQESVED